MKSNLEENFKNAFEEYELPYNEKAWTSLNEKLDKLQGTNAPTTKPSNTWKWIAGTAIVASTAVMFAVIQNESPESNKKTADISEIKKKNKNQSKSVNLTEKQKETNNTESSGSLLSATENNQQKKNIGINQTSIVTENNVIKNKPTGIELSKGNIDKGNTNTNQTILWESKVSENPPYIDLDKKNNIPPSASKTVIFPEIESVCENTIIPISNKNSMALTIISPNGNTTYLDGQKTVNYKVYEAGTYTISEKNTNNKSTFVVKEAPKVDFEINEDMKYENGIPSIPVESLVDGSNFEWSFEGSKFKQYGSKATAHFYKKGTYSITLKSKNNLGCESTLSRSVTIENDYNLLAPSGFMPLSDDPRKNRFIPIALTIRNTAFKMTILDPRTGAIVFETTSVEGWDGVDRNTRQIVEENKSYVWKVILATPEQGEPKEYKGVLVRL